MQFWTIEEQLPIHEGARLRAKQFHQKPPFIEKTSFWSMALEFVESIINDPCKALSFGNFDQQEVEKTGEVIEVDEVN